MLRQGRQAQELRSSDAYQLAMDDIRRGCISMWENGADVAEREHAHTLLQAVKFLDSALIARENGAAMADHEMKRREKVQ